jgi:predicted metal-binding protein
LAKYENYIKRAKELGVSDALIIPANTVVTAEWVRIKCQFGCDGYNRGLCCPPNSPTPEQTKKMLSYYKNALLIHTDGTIEINEIVPILEKEIFFDGYFKAFGMGAGPCYLCEKCPKFCKHPEKARPAMEACGIDVFSTVRAHGLPIETLKTRNCKGNYYGLVLIE